MTNLKEKNQYEKYNHKESDVFGRLTLTGVTYFKEQSGHRRRIVEAKCECGVIRDYVFDSIKRGKIRSCGCLLRDSLKESPHAKTHGLRHHPLYTVYRGMKERCYRPKSISYPNYGARGIIICPEWLKDFKVFFDWAISNGWRHGFDIDRIDNDGIYEPGNCRFVTDKVSSRNRRSNVNITAFGETKCIQAWAEDARCVVSYKGLWGRLNRDKADWPDVEKAMTTPPGFRGMNINNRADNRTVFAFGEEKSITEWLKDSRCVVSEKTLRNRIRKQWSAEKALITIERKSRLLNQPVI